MREPAKPALLIAEDDPNIRYLFEAAAARAAVFGTVTSAPDGEVALQLLRSCDPSKYPDLIVSDLSMPRLTGVELVRALKRDPLMRSIPVAIVTSSNIPNDREDALAAGACAFLEKPQGLEALTRLLAGLRESCLEGIAGRR